MSRVSLRDMKALLDVVTVEDDCGVQGSNFTLCLICQNESGAGVLRRAGWHAKGCPVPRLKRKYERRGQQPKGERDV